MKKTAKLMLAQISPFPTEFKLVDDWEHYEHEIERWETEGGRGNYLAASFTTDKQQE